MKFAQFAVTAVVCFLCCEWGIAQHPGHRHAGFHAGIHSGSWTLKREQLLEEESKDPYRSCDDPYCARCAKHLADYGHEYQFLAGIPQSQLWYPATHDNVAVTTQRGYDQHGFPYRWRGQPSAVISKDYLLTLNHAICEQVIARNAVAAEEAAEDRVVLLTKLLEDAQEQFRLTSEAWERIKQEEKPSHKIITAKKVGLLGCTKTYKQFCAEMKAGQYEIAKKGMCTYCLAQSRYLFDKGYVNDVECELTRARQHLTQVSAKATEAVRIALLSKEDADRATRFKRIQFKPPKYKEVLAAREATQSLSETHDVPEQPIESTETE